MKFRKRPVVVEARQYTGDNAYEIREFTAGHAFEDSSVNDGSDPSGTVPRSMYIRTLEGLMEARPGDWIVQGVHGEFYPCKPDIFVKTYEPLQ